MAEIPTTYFYVCLANSDRPKLNIRQEGDTVNLVGQAVNKTLKIDAHLTFSTSSLPKIRWAMADESDDKKFKTEENFKDEEEFDSLLKEIKRFHSSIANFAMYKVEVKWI